MNSVESFPLPFASLRSFSGGSERPYVIGAMFTPGYEKVKRLLASCEKFGLPYIMHEVPSVHRSVSPRGTLDHAFTKANFIRFLLSAQEKPVLYVDADCEFVEEPKLITRLGNERYDFGIYNWLADEHTDAYGPVEISIAGSPPIKNRFYTFSHSVEHYTPRQLTCSGAVQFYGNTDTAKMLLAEWHRTIMAFPELADDNCLDFTYNNLGPRADRIKMRWFPKAYARYPWWIYAKPIINHPDTPDDEKTSFVPINDAGGRLQFYPDRAEKRSVVRLFPRDCIIDTEEQLLLRRVGSNFAVISSTDQNFWL